MDVSDDPVGVVGHGADGSNREERALEGGHAVESDRYNEELDDRISPKLVPGSSEGQKTIEHAPPGRCPQHEAEENAEHL